VERNNPPQDTIYSSGYDDENGSEDYEIHYPDSQEMLENKPDRTNASKTVNYPRDGRSRGYQGNRNDDLPSDLATTQKDSFNNDFPRDLDQKKDKLMQSDVRRTKDPSLGAGIGNKMGNSMAYPVGDRGDRRKTDEKKKPAGSIEEKFEGSIGPSGSDENYNHDYDGPRAQTFKNRVMKNSKGPADAGGGVGRGSRHGGRPRDQASRDSMLSNPSRDRHCDRDAQPADSNARRSTISSGDGKDKRRKSNTKNLRPAQTGKKDPKSRNTQDPSARTTQKSPTKNQATRNRDNTFGDDDSFESPEFNEVRNPQNTMDSKKNTVSKKSPNKSGVKRSVTSGGKSETVGPITRKVNDLLGPESDEEDFDGSMGEPRESLRGEAATDFKRSKVPTKVGTERDIRPGKNLTFDNGDTNSEHGVRDSKNLAKAGTKKSLKHDQTIRYDDKPQGESENRLKKSKTQVGRGTKSKLQASGSDPDNSSPSPKDYGKSKTQVGRGTKSKPQASGSDPDSRSPSPEDYGKSKTQGGRASKSKPQASSNDPDSRSPSPKDYGKSKTQGGRASKSRPQASATDSHSPSPKDNGKSKTQGGRASKSKPQATDPDSRSPSPRDTTNPKPKLTKARPQISQSPQENATNHTPDSSPPSPAPHTRPSKFPNPKPQNQPTTTPTRSLDTDTDDMDQYTPNPPDPPHTNPQNPSLKTHKNGKNPKTQSFASKTQPNDLKSALNSLQRLIDGKGSNKDSGILRDELLDLPEELFSDFDRERIGGAYGRVLEGNAGEEDERFLVGVLGDIREWKLDGGDGGGGGGGGGEQIYERRRSSVKSGGRRGSGGKDGDGRKIAGQGTVNTGGKRGLTAKDGDTVNTGGKRGLTAKDGDGRKTTGQYPKAGGDANRTTWGTQGTFGVGGPDSPNLRSTLDSPNPQGARDKSPPKTPEDDVDLDDYSLQLNPKTTNKKPPFTKTPNPTKNSPNSLLKKPPSPTPTPPPPLPLPLHNPNLQPQTPPNHKPIPNPKNPVLSEQPMSPENYDSQTMDYIIGDDEIDSIVPPIREPGVLLDFDLERVFRDILEKIRGGKCGDGDVEI
jgi:hypothetical protein